MENCKWTTTGDIECGNIDKSESTVVFKSVLVNHPLQEMNLKKQTISSLEQFDQNAYLKMKEDIKTSIKKSFNL